MATFRLLDAMKKAYEADSKITELTGKVDSADGKLANLNITSHDIEWTTPAAGGLFTIKNPTGYAIRMRPEDSFAAGFQDVGQFRLYSGVNVTARFNGDGDSWGNAWGGWLSAKLATMVQHTTNTAAVANDVYSRMSSVTNPTGQGFTVTAPEPRHEFHQAGTAARMFYLGADSIFRLSVSNGGGGAVSVISQWSGNSFYNSGDIEAAGNVIAFSDRKLKDDIKKTGGLAAISKLEGVEWVWKKTGDVGAGLIAQDVQAVLPSAIKVCEDETLGLNYNAVIGLLVNAVNELRQQVEELQCQING